MPVILTLERSRQEHQDFQASSLRYMTRFYVIKQDQTGIIIEIISIFVGERRCKSETNWKRISYLSSEPL